MTTPPSISIICLCYNHERFVEQALESIFKQDYVDKEIILIDDCSTDSSSNLIESMVQKFPDLSVVFIQNTENLGNCSSFNLGLQKAKGKYIIDFATDDLMMKGALSKQVAFFESQSDDVGLIYSNAVYFTEHPDEPNSSTTHFGAHTNWIPHQGEVYSSMIKEYFVPTPTLVFRKSVLDNLGGYDSDLAYEDFDILIRIARSHHFAYYDEVLVQVRKSSHSMSTGWYKKGDPQVYSTYLICKKIIQLNQNLEEQQALIQRLKYQIRMCFANGLTDELKLFHELLKEQNGVSFQYWIMAIIGRLGIRFRGN